MDNPTQNNNYLPLGQLVDYQIIEAVYSGSRTLVYRAIRIYDQLPVVIKLLRNNYPTFSEITQFRNQYSITKNLNSPHIVQTYSLEPYQNGYGLVMEDFGGISLQSWDMNGRNKLSLPEFLKIAIDLCNILNILYQARIIHKDIKPSNILINPETKQVKLIDFSIASLLPRETQTLLHPNVLEGTLAYISPEQTGRMNRGIDYRTDSYSLGVTFYELLTGELPFQSNDPMELVHSHIAKSAPLVHETNSEIPPVISKIVSKLMAKNAEDRYQNALGIRHDLEICLHQLQENGKIISFEIAQRDISDRFLIPDKLYGREQEVETLLQAFERVSLGATEMMLVTGFSGIGKTAVVNEVHKPIVRQRGYFIKGKYDQFQRNIPLSAFVQVFQDLIMQISAESDTQIQQWKNKILDAVGENGQVIIEVIPELTKIIGEQHPAIELSGTAAQSRFNLLFQKFTQVFTSLEHPLVIFLDDLQWADSLSLKLIELLMADTKHLFLIGAYRDNEVSLAHPLILTLSEIVKKSATINTITLAPLSQIKVNQLVTDTLKCSEDLAWNLSQLIYQKTQGNPFFATQFLKALYQDQLIQFDFELGCWHYDIDQVSQQILTDDVVAFMALQLQKLPQSTQNILQLAACIGNQFDLATLAIVSELSQLETAVVLWEALKEGLILPTSEVYKFYVEQSVQAQEQESQTVSYKFLHDRVQQAAYSLIPDQQKQRTHWQIGKILLNHTNLTQKEVKIFEIVNQLNYGISLITQPMEREPLATLNLLAGQKAKLSAAYASAYKYFEQGRTLLEKDCWQSHYRLAVDLHIAVIEAAFLNSDYETMKTIADLTLPQITDIHDQVKIHESLILYYHIQSHFRDAVNLAVQTLTQLGETFPSSPDTQNFVDALNTTTHLIQEIGIEQIDQLPLMQNPEKLAAMRILRSSCFPAYFAAPEMLGLLICRLVDLTLKYGYSPLTPFAYGIFSVLMNGGVSNIELGAKFCELAISLENQQDTLQYRALTYNVCYGLSRHFYKPVQESLEPLIQGYQSFSDNGDAESSAYCLINAYFCSILSGVNLVEIQKKFEKYIHHVVTLKNEQVIHQLHIWTQVIHNLSGQGQNPMQLKGRYFDIDQLLPELYETQNFNTINYAYVAQVILFYKFGEYEQALTYAEKTAPFLGSSTGKFFTSVYNFYYSLSLIAVYNQVSIATQAQYLKKIHENQKQLQHWTDYCPANFEHKYLLVQAELAQITQMKMEAIDLYDKAIAGAKENGYIQEEALANELAAKFYLDWGKEKIATVYMQEAYYCYVRWGAKAKTDNLEKCYPQLLNSILQQSYSRLSTYETVFSLETVTSATSATSGNSISVSLDLAAILKASQTISGEIELEKLLTSLLSIVIENAGANKCVLMLLGDDSLGDMRGKGESLLIEGAITLGMEPVVLQSLPVEESRDIPLKLINKVKLDRQTVVLIDVSKDLTLANDPYIVSQQPKSILCSPILHQGQLMGILYLENNLVTGAFTSDRVKLLNLICTQAAISLENARLYEREQQKSQALEKALNDLQNTQIQLVQGEKMSALGNLVAGVAHEMNNPLGFISASLKQAKPTFDDIFEHLRLYQEKFPSKSEEIIDHESEIDLEYSLEDLPKMINSMMMACDRLKNISTSLRTFSRADRDYKVPFNLHDGLDSTILILKHRLKANDQHPEIEVITNYGNTPAINCFPGQLNQVFMNILANAIDALEESNQGRSFVEIQAHPNKITIATTVVDRHIQILILDNGKGMTEEVKNKVFDHLFTTKEVGKGTGLGLAIARQIVEEKHQGTISVTSKLGQGTEFIITLPISTS